MRTDVAVVGAGIVGMAHALEASRRGKSVALFDRNSRAVGASIRNFGMIWPIGQPPGRLLERALRSRAAWLDLSKRAGFWAQECGSLHLAYSDDETAVLREFAARECATENDRGFRARVVSPEEARRLSHGVQPNGLQAALWSETEAVVDPREAIAKLCAYLEREANATLRLGVGVNHVEPGRLVATNGETWQAESILVCSGEDFQSLYPEVFAETPLKKCKLQMLRTPPQPDGWRMGPHLAGGLTLLHYKAFAACTALATLRQRCEATLPEYLHWGIHVMASQNHAGELVLGDSHEYGDTHDPFIRESVNNLIMDYLRRFVSAPTLEIAERWVGIYPKMMDGRTEFVHTPEPGVWIVNGLGGNGMTLSFGLAQEVWSCIDSRESWNAD